MSTKPMPEAEFESEPHFADNIFQSIFLGENGFNFTEIW